MVDIFKFLRSVVILLSNTTQLLAPSNYGVSIRSCCIPFAGAMLWDTGFGVITVVQSKYCVKIIGEQERRVSLVFDYFWSAQQYTQPIRK